MHVFIFDVAEGEKKRVDETRIVSSNKDKIVKCASSSQRLGIGIATLLTHISHELQRMFI